MRSEQVQLDPAEDGVLRLTLCAPRANALTPELLDAIRAALDSVDRAGPSTLIVAGGRNFCSGGDVARFLDAADRGMAKDYARQVVPALQEVVLRLFGLSATVAVAARGAITGGGAGLLFAADCAVLAPDAFVQPFYARMGFAPDGGWTALLPDRIGRAHAGAWIATDRRQDAEALKGLGICDAVDADPEAAALRLLDGTSAGTRIAAKRLLRDETTLKAVAAALDAETAAFLDRIDTPDVARRMADFVGVSRDAAHV
ncbi:enoyl-CoA hydratase/isomerase family protein [Pseudoroseicyclus tamaricis]|uniref:Enoyl-CoA hydratase/isomerase family protein n=1 Tax=Pseudoroseicyclus tamaricis TaxID=2705421 RepID=A0A6B2JMX6_9RHOB|nr:enoyl-CoA hydratase/isomerase family protein [Pseudoroseicyclus tamaricis]NDV00017.1 enoyl-CoA hydratase/isomerase family protein [Pseudoroseicyclus tamaricis]